MFVQSPLWGAVALVSAQNCQSEVFDTNPGDVALELLWQFRLGAIQVLLNAMMGGGVCGSVQISVKLQRCMLQCY